MTGQLSLDDAPHARESDPDTSQAAARQIITTQNADCMAVLAALARLGGHANAHEVWRHLSQGPRVWRESVVSKRISSLRDNGYVRDSGVRRCGSTTREQIVWTCTLHGWRTAEEVAA